MKPSTFLAAFAGLGFVSASAMFKWRSPNANQIDPQVRAMWEERCRRAGCSAGSSIFHDHTELAQPGGAEPLYLNVKEASAPSMLSLWRVFQDGSSEPGWTRDDRQAIIRGLMGLPQPRQTRGRRGPSNLRTGPAAPAA